MNKTWFFIHENDFKNEDYKAVFKQLDEYVSRLYIGVCYISLENKDDGTAILTMKLYPSKNMMEEQLERALGEIFDSTD